MVAVQPGYGEAAQQLFPEQLDQTPEFDPTDPEPVPNRDLDQTRAN